MPVSACPVVGGGIARVCARGVRMGVYVGGACLCAGMQSCVAVCGAVWPWRGRGRGLRRAVVVSWLKFAMLSVVGSGFVPNISY